jgi:hypothetical protein
MCIALRSRWHAECKIDFVKLGTLKIIELTNRQYLHADDEPDKVHFTLHWIFTPVCIAVPSAFLLSAKPGLDNQLPWRA